MRYCDKITIQDDLVLKTTLYIFDCNKINIHIMKWSDRND
ncbi:hypothetical protein CPAL_04020 [Clostridium thermopalmarium DSM 5974]|jgi:hypothetical protein|uniref:Uncharacterized protein n=1 Tax=Clostridium thermopalmarium DSM 5974 TaxID=1121340 RepID=A0A2T0AYD1_9CLOT|nr:hypothetical protein CPAL_04020 [Clostridium thermopalmarium DSM 5974]PVZ24488.1 hypothetical protein LX19_01182 [Clostridium thermopalmarium DSM 5974]